jgi:ABC-2 type transport system permease protein
MTDVTPQTPAAAPLARTRPFYWSVRREVWENRAVYLAPLAVAGVVLVGFLISLRHVPTAARVLAGPAPGPDAPHAQAAEYARQSFVLLAPQFTPAAILVTALIVAVFYSLASLHAERRDRSVLFWKSLPVSDRTTVLSKAFVPLAVLPPVVFVVMLATQAIMLGLSSAAIATNGLSPAILWSRMPTPAAMVVGLAYGLVVLSLWYAPIVGWLMLVSAWAKRMTFLWAVAPPLAVCLFELVAFRTHYAWTLLHSRLVDGLAAFTIHGEGKKPIHDLSQVDPMVFLADPALWSGLVFAAAAFALCTWLRRRSDPI